MSVKGLIIAALIISVASCSSQPKRRTLPRPTEVATVKVGAVNRIYVNERIVTLDELKK
jgi:hypothetical protein